MVSLVLVLVIGTFSMSPVWYSQDEAITMDVCVFHANADAYPDILFSVYAADGSGELQLYLNDGGTIPVSPDWTTDHDAAYQCVCVGDVDNDGDNDIAAGTVRAETGYAYNCLFLNNGSGSFSGNPVWSSIDDMDTVHMQLADIDSDGWLELIAGNYLNKTVVYENNYGSASGLVSQPESWFGHIPQTAFAVSQFEIADPYQESMDILCTSDYDYEAEPISATRIYSYDPANPPVEQVWQFLDGEKPTSGFWYQITDLNLDGRADFVSYAPEPCILAGIYDPGADDFQGYTISSLSSPWSEFDFMAICNVFAADLIQGNGYPGMELFVCNRGTRRFVPGGSGEREMHLAEDMLLTVTWDSGTPEASVEWVSTEKVPTTSVGFADLDRSGITQHTESFTITVPNQTFYLCSPYERIITVAAGGSILSPGQYHADRNAGTVGIVGSYGGCQLSVTYEVSSSLEVVCATTGENIIYQAGR